MVIWRHLLRRLRQRVRQKLSAVTAATDWSGSKVEGAGDGESRGRRRRKGQSSGGGGNFRVSNFVTKSFYEQPYKKGAKLWFYKLTAAGGRNFGCKAK